MFTRFWNFTWDTNKDQKKLPNKEKLISFLDRIADSAVFQEEKGAKRGKIHYQGMFALDSKRTSKTKVLLLFAETFRNVKGLTLTQTFSSIASSDYCTKTEGRVSGPYYCGKSEKYDSEIANMKLSEWQQTIFDALTSKEVEELRGRNVISIHDSIGRSGKSQFTKWLRVGQKKLEVRKLPVASVQQLNSAVYLITKNQEIDLFIIDITRSLGEDQSFKDLFSAIEDVVNGYVVDVMFGKYHEALFKPPLVLIFTNFKFEEIHKYMSTDRWVPFLIGPSKAITHIIHDKGNVHGYVPFQNINYTKK